MLVIPAIDIIDNQVVRLSEGKYETKKIYGDSPVEQARSFKKFGFKRIHIVDLIGSKEGSLNVKNILGTISSELQLEIQFGGGIRTRDDVKELLSLGVGKLILGSLPLNDWRLFETIVNEFGADKFIIAADSQNGEIKFKGWTQNSGINLFDYIEKCAGLGIGEFLCTDISLDGMNMGPAFDLYGKLLEQFGGINLIASGGIRNLNDIEKLDRIGAYAAVVGKAIYEGNIKEEELKKIAD